VKPFHASLLVALATLGLSAFVPARALAHPDGTYPRTFNLDWGNIPDAYRNSRYDMVSLSARAATAKFDSITALNPACTKLVCPGWYCYYDAGPSGYPPTYGPWSTTDPMYGYDRRFWDLLNENNWWAWGVDSVGTRYHASGFWLMWFGNFSSKCPVNAQGKRLCDVFGDFVVDQLVSQKHADGVFFDNLWDSPRWLDGAMGGCQPGTNCAVQTPGTYWRCHFDLDANGVADPPDSLDVWWKQGITIVFDKIRQRMGPNFVIIGNGQHHFATANGLMEERFPRIHGQLDPPPNPWNFRWQDAMFGVDGYVSSASTRFSAPVRNVIDTELGGGDRWTYPSGSQNQQLFRFNLGSALLGEGYIALNNGGYNCYYWQPEYNLRLGWPMGPAVPLTIGGAEVWKRMYTNGVVWVNPKSVPLAAGATNPAVAPWDAAIIQTSGTIDTGGVPPAPAIRFDNPRPNPFASTGTTMSFSLGVGENARLEILDTKGRRVRRVWQGTGTGTWQSAAWDGKSDEGWLAPVGVYFARIEGEAGRHSQQKLLRVR